ncbi:MAG: tRNA pseudouridine(38-40) synthase TruA [Boseongicola sp.]|nr:tRNA pseudouridine(38-40) synthase TruA [Boseongicola sp.]
MPRFAFTIEYNGQPFSGWQRQPDQPSVQGAIETALTRIDKSAPLLSAAGRTDAGVHAYGQVAHADMATNWDPFRLSEALNFHLKPNPIAITACTQVDSDWHARFSAIERNYIYRLINRRAPLVHDAGLAWRVQKPLDLDAMRDGAAHLIGAHDFTTFRSTMCQAKSPHKTLDEITITENFTPSGPEIAIAVRARSFLHNQVRSIVGTLERVGSGGWQPEDVKTALEAKDRAACGPVAPPDGLYLSHVVYNPDVFA